ncbi:MAG: class I SAM-dependent methyltransferase [Woeseiaceae bacterium]
MPDSATLAHSETVEAFVRQRIDEAGGALSFAEYMQAVLYTPGLGYYAAGSRKFAEQGDFTTAPEISPLFGQVVAKQCAEVFQDMAEPAIIEYGAGTGALASVLLATLGELDALPVRYYIVEVSPDLQARQQAHLQKTVPDLMSRLEWVADPTALVVEGVVLGNEVLDALPAERFRVDEDGQYAQQTVVREADELKLAWRPAPPALTKAIDALQVSLAGPLPAGYVSELCLAAPAWLASLAANLTRGVVLLSDYGYGQDDYYSPDRDGGTLMCHYRHHAHADPLFLPGGQDLTTWVNFTQVAESLDAAGMQYLGFASQAQFLMQGGIGDWLAGPDVSLALSRGAKTLMMPGEMGERFRFIGFSKNIATSMSGFSGRDYGWQL